jgi:serine/threonine-protein kinase TNNI3K
MSPGRTPHPSPHTPHEGSGRQKPFLDRIRVAAEVAQGMYALECLDPPLLHRDIKPSNIFVDGAGHARVSARARGGHFYRAGYCIWNEGHMMH